MSDATWTPREIAKLLKRMEKAERERDEARSELAPLRDIALTFVDRPCQGPPLDIGEDCPCVTCKFRRALGVER